jgi:hypothetical protein
LRFSQRSLCLFALCLPDLFFYSEVEAARSPKRR